MRLASSNTLWRARGGGGQARAARGTQGAYGAGVRQGRHTSRRAGGGWTGWWSVCVGGGGRETRGLRPGEGVGGGVHGGRRGGCMCRAREGGGDAWGGRGPTHRRGAVHARGGERGGGAGGRGALPDAHAVHAWGARCLCAARRDGGSVCGDEMPAAAPWRGVMGSRGGSGGSPRRGSSTSCSSHILHPGAQRAQRCLHTLALGALCLQPSHLLILRWGGGVGGWGL